MFIRPEPPFPRFVRPSPPVVPRRHSVSISLSCTTADEIETPDFLAVYDHRPSVDGCLLSLFYLPGCILRSIPLHVVLRCPNVWGGATTLRGMIFKTHSPYCGAIHLPHGGVACGYFICAHSRYMQGIYMSSCRIRIFDIGHSKVRIVRSSLFSIVLPWKFGY